MVYNRFGLIFNVYDEAEIPAVFTCIGSNMLFKLLPGLKHLLCNNAAFRYVIILSLHASKATPPNYCLGECKKIVIDGQNDSTDLLDVTCPFHLHFFSH